MQNYQWDAVFACSGAWINARLKESEKKFPASFAYEDDAVKISGDFGSWTMVPGGTGRFIHFDTPVTKGTLLDKASGKSYPLDGAIPIVQFQLDFVTPAGKSDQKHLKFDCRVVGKNPGDKTPGAVTVLNPDSRKDSPIPGLVSDVLGVALAHAFIASRQELSFVFAELSLAPPAGASWLTLKQLTYAYQQNDDNELGNLAVLGMLSDVSIKNIEPVFDTQLMQGGHDFGFVLAASRFFEHVLLPAMPQAYRGSNASQFSWDGATKISNHGNVTLDKVKVGLIWYPPVIQNLDIHLEGNLIRTTAAGRCDITGLDDAYISFSVASKNPGQYLPASRSIAFAKDPHKSITHSSHIPWWEKLLGGLTAGIMNVVIDAVSLAIEDAVTGAIGNTGISSNGMGAQLVTWPGQNAITPTGGGLEDNFYFQGTL